MTAGFHYRFKHDYAVAVTAGFHFAGNWLELEGISHVVSLVSFLDVKAENNFTNKIVVHQTTIESPKNSSLVILLYIHIFRNRNYEVI